MTSRPLERLINLSAHITGTSYSALAAPQYHIESNECCGIVGFVGPEQALPYLVDGIQILQNRGYDSAGITTIHEGKLITTKYASVGVSDAVDNLVKNSSHHAGHTIGIAHTRWATHGGKTDSNAHPHTDMRNRFALAHNGVIENSSILKKELIEKGVKFESETDTEVIVQLIGHYAATEKLDTMEAVHKALGRLEGTWGLVILDSKKPGQIIAAKNGSPLLIGIAQGRMFVASEQSAFSQHTKEFISLENGEIALITSSGHSLDAAPSRIELASHETITISPDPYPHWTIKEIYEQPSSISRSLNYGGRFIDDKSVKLGGLDGNRHVLRGVKHLIISACGTSYHAALYGAQLMRHLNSFETIQVIDSAELTREFIPKTGAGFMVISQSGETKDVLRSLAIAQEASIPCFSVVNVVGSAIARATGCGVYLYAGREVAVASTKAFSCQVSALSLISIWFSALHDQDELRRRHLVDSLHRLPTNMGMTINNLHRQCKDISVKIQHAKSMFILGKGYAEPIAREGSLKIKEISYIHAEGYPGGALKHGPFALIDKDVPIVLIILQDQHASLMKTAAHEVRTRGAHVIVITDIRDNISEYANDVIVVPSNGPLTALLASVPLQLIAYELAILRGINPDKPRHLAKAVTVD